MKGPLITHLVLLVAGFVAGGTMSAVYGQPPRPMIYVVDFRKVEPGREQQYLQMEREVWRGVHAARIAGGQMRLWELYEVRYPQGTGRPYDFVTVNGFE